MTTEELDNHFMQAAYSIAKTLSTDTSRQTGCVIVSPDDGLLVMDANHFPDGVQDTPERHQRPAKYKWTEHCERNAIYRAAREGIRLGGARIYMPWYPCVDCARAIIQAGLVELIGIEPDWNDPIWKVDFADVPVMLSEGKVKVRFWKGEAPKPIL